LRRLLIRPGAIGDCILALPAMECLRAQYTEVWASSQNLPLLRFADRTRSVASTGLDLLGLPDHEPPASLLGRLRSFDSIISWYGTNRPEFRHAGRRFDLSFQFLPALPKCAAGIHAADFYLRQARSISNCQCDAVPHIDCPRRDEGLAVIHPFSGSAKKNWPLEQYRQLAAGLSKQMPVRWCAGPNEDWTVASGAWSVEAMGIEDLFELGCWLARARIYVGNDSGITHLAAAAGAPVVALFGPTDPAVWAPRGRNVRVVATARPGESIERITLDEVLSAALRHGPDEGGRSPR
jgi:hypothetical protein